MYYVWITSPKSDYFSDLTGVLLKRGYTVGPLGRSGVLQYVDRPAAVIALTLNREPRSPEEEAAWTPSGVHEEVMDAVKILKIQVISIIVCKSCACTWNTGNMSVSRMEAEESAKKGNIN